MEAWMTFWEYACLVGFGAFYLLVVVVIPLGAKDLRALFRVLDSHREQADTDPME